MRHLHVRLIVAALVLLVGSRPVCAQSTYNVRVDSNTHVRLIPRDTVMSRPEGRVVHLANDTIVLRDNDVLVRRALSDLSAIEVRGGKNHVRGITYGAGVATAITAVFGGVDLAKGDISTDDFIGTMLGNAVVGGVIGYFLAPTGWQRIPLVGAARR